MQKIFPIPYDTAQFSRIETVPSPGDVAIQVVDPEFSSVCPKTGLPDYGTVIIRYKPGHYIAELKSLKLYLRCFYGVGAFHELVTERIFNDFTNVIFPPKCAVIINWGARGGLHTTTMRKTPLYDGEEWHDEMFINNSYWDNR